MRIAFSIVALTTVLGGCAMQPVTRPPVISPTGEFRGPVVSDRGVPFPARYEGYCELETGRWTHGGYRAYTPAPCDPERVVRERVVREPVVRAYY
jgi:hypothetical protein